jgi:hypothetical protein
MNDDRDPFEQLSDNERAEYERWSEWLDKKMKEQEDGTKR